MLNLNNNKILEFLLENGSYKNFDIKKEYNDFLEFSKKGSDYSINVNNVFYRSLYKCSNEMLINLALVQLFYKLLFGLKDDSSISIGTLMFDSDEIFDKKRKFLDFHKNKMIDFLEDLKNNNLYYKDFIDLVYLKDLELLKDGYEGYHFNAVLKGFNAFKNLVNISLFENENSETINDTNFTVNDGVYFVLDKTSAIEYVKNKESNGVYLCLKYDNHEGNIYHSNFFYIGKYKNNVSIFDFQKNLNLEKVKFSSRSPHREMEDNMDNILLPFDILLNDNIVNNTELGFLKDNNNILSINSFSEEQKIFHTIMLLQIKDYFLNSPELETKQNCITGKFFKENTLLLSQGYNTSKSLILNNKNIFNIDFNLLINKGSVIEYLIQYYDIDMSKKLNIVLENIPNDYYNDELSFQNKIEMEFKSYIIEIISEKLKLENRDYLKSKNYLTYINNIIDLDKLKMSYKNDDIKKGVISKSGKIDSLNVSMRNISCKNSSLILIDKEKINNFDFLYEVHSWQDEKENEKNIKRFLKQSKSTKRKFNFIVVDNWGIFSSLLYDDKISDVKIFERILTNNYQGNSHRDSDSDPFNNISKICNYYSKPMILFFEE